MIPRGHGTHTAESCSLLSREARNTNGRTRGLGNATTESCEWRDFGEGICILPLSPPRGSLSSTAFNKIPFLGRLYRACFCSFLLKAELSPLREIQCGPALQDIGMGPSWETGSLQMSQVTMSLFRVVPCGTETLLAWLSLFFWFHLKCNNKVKKPLTLGGVHTPGSEDNSECKYSRLF